MRIEDYYYMYFVIFKSTEINNEGPIIKCKDYRTLKKEYSNGTMHLFDTDLKETLEAIEYIMHLPRIIFDVFELDENFLNASHDTPHNIILMPDLLFLTNEFNLNNIVPAMFIYTESCNQKVIAKCKGLNSILGNYSTSELNQDLLKEHWNKLWQYSSMPDYDMLNDIDIHFLLKNDYFKALPVLFLSRQLGNTKKVLAEIFNNTDVEKKCIDIQFNNKMRINTLVSLGEKGVTTFDDKSRQMYKEIHESESKKFDLSVVITFPGVSKLQIRYGLSAPILSNEEKNVIRILGVHRAIARGGILLELPCANENMFRKIDELEQRCKNGTNNRYVWKTLRDIGKLFADSLSSYQIEVIKRAKDITVFSDLPIGLAILEGEEVPLQCYKKISYRSLTPLTRALQLELNKVNQIYLGKKCKVAMAECVLENDDVYSACELVHMELLKMEKEYPNVSISYEQTYSVESIKKFISSNQNADILYISAHGCYHRENNLAGIMVGNEFWMGDANIAVPPIVLLSACHTNPKGIGVVNIADMFMRNGAVTVLGTFIPVDAIRNALLMTRLFIYIMEAQNGSKQYKTLDEAWCGVVSSNAIHELMAASSGFKTWMHGNNKDGKPRIIDFQLERCVGRLRLSHVYSDTITIIKEMLAEEGKVGKFADILDMNNFFPESFFYQFVGSPENVFLYNEIIEKVQDEKVI